MLDRPEQYKSDQELFDEAYTAHNRAVYAYLLGRTSNDNTAEDLLQEVFLRVWRHIDKLRTISSERRPFWIFSIARNIVTDYYRQRAVIERSETAMPDAEVRDPKLPDPYRELEAEESSTEINVAISNLPDDLRTALVMHAMGEMTSAEIGKILGKPAGTVRYMLSQARRFITDALDDSPSGEGVR